MTLRRDRRFFSRIVNAAVCGLLLAAAVPRLLSQEVEPRFRRYGVDNGISQNSIFGILQDRRGFIWFGTQDGLNRFDGFNFRIFKPVSGDPGSLSNPYLLSLVEDRDGSLWIGTDGGGLNKYDPATERFASYRHDPRSPESLSADRVNALLADGQGRLWVGTPNGLDLFLPASGTFIHYKSNPNDKSSLGSNVITCLHEDSAGALWIGTNDGGLNRLDPRSGRFVRLFGRMTVNAVLSQGESGLWIGTNHGLVWMDRANGQIVTYKSNPDNPDGLAQNTVTSLLRDRAGRLWIGTGDGLDRFDPKTLIFVHHRNDPSNPASLSNSSIVSLCEDRAGGIWVGTGVSGLNYFDPWAAAFAIIRDWSNDPISLRINGVWSILEDESGLIWMGTNAGILSLDRRTGRRNLFSNDPGNPDSLSAGGVRTLMRDRAGVLWAGTSEGGLNRFDPVRRRFTHFRHNPDDPGSIVSDALRYILEDSRGNLWIATFGGLDRFDRASNRFEHYRNDPADPGSLSDDRAYALLEDHSGVLWVGTWGGGLNRFDPATRRFEHFRHEPDNPASLGENSIVSIREDAFGVLWVGTRGGGLCRLGPDRKTFKTYGIKDGLPNDVIYAILVDGAGNLWLTHNRGLSRFTPGTGAVKTFDVSDGLQSLEFNANACLKSRSGELFFGGVNGVNVFFPDAIKTNPIIPEIVISGLQVFNKPVSIGPDPNGRAILDRSVVEADTVRLSYKDRIVTFEFAALHYAAPEKNEYAYRLEKLETSWNQVGTRRIATYTNLPPGRYVFRVKGSNNDGVWNEQGASLAVWVSPPFWKRLWFQGLALMAVLGALAAAARYRTRHLVESKRQLEARVEERTAELKATTVRIQEEVAERRRAEEALRKEKLYMDLLFENAPEAIILVGADHHIVRANREFSRLFGFDPEEVVGRNIDEIVTSGPYRQEAEGYTRDLDQGLNIVFESERMRKDGTPLHVSGIGAPIRFDGRFQGYFAIYRDITDRIKAEEALRQEKLRLDLLVESAPEAIVVVDKDHRITRVNGEFVRMFGYSAEETVGRNIDDVVSSKATRGEAEGYTTELSQGKPIAFEGLRTRKDGTSFTISGIGAPIRIDGRNVGYFAIYRDITERKRAEEALQRRAAQAALINRVGQRVGRKLEIGPLLQEIVDAVHEAFQYQGVHLFLLDASQLKLNLQAVAGVYRALFRDEDGLAIGQGIIGAAFSQGLSINVGDVSREPNYLRIATENTRSELAVPIRSEDKVIGVLDFQSADFNAFDETEVAAMETLSTQIGSAIANARLFEEVQLELAERMRMEKMLKGLTKDLARSNKELEQFAYVASHDLQEPLRMVGSYVQLLARRYKGKLDQDADDFISFAVDGATRMQNMINDLLAYSRVGTRSKPFVSAGIESVLNRALLNLQVAIAEKGAVISHDPLPTVTCDETQLIQLFQNLVGNAVKFQDQSRGAPVIKIGAVLRDREWVFSVRDNGIGIEPQYLERIFHIFERLHRDNEYPGTGIGLALCKKIVERHGGRIWVESEPGQGSTFLFTIPNR